LLVLLLVLFCRTATRGVPDTNSYTNKMLVWDGIQLDGLRQQKTRDARKHAGFEMI
jgi:hypothetical protein